MHLGDTETQEKSSDIIYPRCMAAQYHWPDVLDQILTHNNLPLKQALTCLQGVDI
jgi:hypothetical protein